jgi:hypothetical protein
MWSGMALEQRHGALSGRHHEHGTTHWHSTPGGRNGSQLLGMSFSFACMVSLLVFFSFFALWMWECGDNIRGRESRARCVYDCMLSGC